MIILNNNPCKIIIYAPNVHGGGGGILLKKILYSISCCSRIVLFAHENLSIDDEQTSVEIVRVKSTVRHRLFADISLARMTRSGDCVFMFGNLPPLMRINCQVVVFLQNRYLLEKISLKLFPFRSRIRLMVERAWLFLRESNVDEFIVQTNTMKKLLQVITNKPVHVLPFVGDMNVPAENEMKKFDFIYPASGEPHKNHCTLIDAWVQLADEDIYPSLVLTLDKKKEKDLFNYVCNMVKEKQLKIILTGELTQSEVLRLYRNSGALIFPSLLESFGLPLVEAKILNLPILASELDYVRDILNPVQSFDPTSALSIARAVKRYFNIDEQVAEILTTEQFLDKISL